MSASNKPVNQKAWFLILPMLVCVAFSAILPLMTVVNYSVQDIISPERRIFVGTEWFVAIMRDEELHGALLRQITFSLAVLLIEIPLGIALALSMPAQGCRALLELDSTQPLPVNSVASVVPAHRNRLSGVTAPELYVPQAQLDRGGVNDVASSTWLSP